MTLTMEVIKASKSILRKEIKKKLAFLTNEYKKQQSEIVIKKLFSLKQFEDSKRISIYLSTENEICTESVLQKIFDTQKLCFVPRYNKNLMEMVKLDSMKDYENLPLTKWNIKQPELKEQRDNAMETGGLELVIVPGVAFTKCGKRMGHGKGYYDIFLSNLIKTQKVPPTTVALAFKEQILNDIPCNDNDVKIDHVLFVDN